MIERLQTIWDVGFQDAKRHIRSQRMIILSPLIVMTISMACWGFADSMVLKFGDMGRSCPEALEKESGGKLAATRGKRHLSAVK